MYTTALMPVFLNQSPRVSFFERAEIMTFMCVWILFFLFDFMVIGFLLGVLAVKARRALQKSSFGDLTKIGVYWLLPHGFSKSFFKVLPPCYVREMLG